MRNLILVALLFMFGFSQAQTVRFSEDFETAPYQATSDSISGNAEWDTTTFVQYSGNQSYFASITTTSSTVNDTIVLTTDSFPTTGHNSDISKVLQGSSWLGNRRQFPRSNSPFRLK